MRFSRKWNVDATIKNRTNRRPDPGSFSQLGLIRNIDFRDSKF